MKRSSFFARLIMNALAFLIVSSLYSGMTVRGFWSAMVAACIWGVVNALLRPFLVLLTLPLNILTFGLFTFVINGLLLMLTSALHDGLHIAGLFAGIIAAVLFSIVNVLLSMLLVDEKKR